MADWQQLTLHSNDGRTLEVSADLDSLDIEAVVDGTTLYKAQLSVMIAGGPAQQIACIFDEADGAAMPISVTADDMNALRSAAGVADEGELPPPSTSTEENDAAVEEAIVAAAPVIEDIGPEPEPEPAADTDAPAAVAEPAPVAEPAAATAHQPDVEHPAAQPDAAQPAAAQPDAAQPAAAQPAAAQPDAAQQPAAEQVAQPAAQQDTYYEEYESWILTQQPVVIYHRTDTSRSLAGLTWSGGANRVQENSGTWTVEVTLLDGAETQPGAPHHLTIQPDGERYYVFLDAADFDAVEGARNAAAGPAGASGAAADGVEPFDDLAIEALRVAAESDRATFLSGTFAPAEVTVDWDALAADRAQWTKVAGVGWTGAVKCVPAGGTEMTEVAGAVLHAEAGQPYWLELPADMLLQPAAPSSNEVESNN